MSAARSTKRIAIPSYWHKGDAFQFTAHHKSLKVCLTLDANSVDSLARGWGKWRRGNGGGGGRQANPSIMRRPEFSLKGKGKKEAGKNFCQGLLLLLLPFSPVFFPEKGEKLLFLSPSSSFVRAREDPFLKKKMPSHRRKQEEAGERDVTLHGTPNTPA